MKINRRADGFTLLEAMVAMVLLSSVGLAVYGLINTNFISLNRVKHVSVQLPIVNAALNYFQTMNIIEESSGQFVVQGAVINWNAALISPYRQSQTAAGYRGNYDIGLYEVSFDVIDSGRKLGSYNILKAGYKKVRSFDE